MKRLNKRGKLCLFSIMIIGASIFVGSKIHNDQVTMQTVHAAGASVHNGDVLVKQFNKEQEAPPVTVPVSTPVDKAQTAIINIPTNQKPSVPITKPSTEKVVYLTFDDGPSNRLEDLMNVLDQYHATATFFWLEPNMKAHAAEVKDAVTRGFSIGLHGVTHDAHKFYASSQSVLNEMNSAEGTLKSLSGYDTKLIRTPYGSYPKMTPAYKQAVVENGFIMWDWNVDSMDWKYLDSRYVNDVISQVKSLEKRNITPVILMHDISETINNLPKLLNFLKTSGFIFKKIDQTIIPLQF